MFNSNRYATRGVVSEIPLETQIFIWSLIDALKTSGMELDYLQVFQLSKVDDIQSVQSIIHKQEVPEYCRKHLIKPTVAVNCKIFVIDSGEYSTMMLSEEY